MGVGWGEGMDVRDVVEGEYIEFGNLSDVRTQAETRQA